MDWITCDSLKTVAGASLAVTLVTAVLKMIYPKMRGRITHIVALFISVVIASVTGKWSSAQDGLVTILNGFTIFAVSVGVDQTLNYKITKKKQAGN